MGTPVIEIGLIVVLVAVNGYFALAEIALISVRRGALKQRAEEGSKGARTALELLENPSRLLATIQIGITLVGFGASATAAVSLAKPVQAWLRGVGVPWLASASTWLSVLLVTIVISYVTLIFGELVPKRIGLQSADRFAVSVAGPVSLLARFSAPLVWLLAHSTDLVAAAFGMKGSGGRPGVSEEEIKLLVTEQGSLLDEEKRMIHEIFELGDTVAREVMVPRVDLALASDDSSVREVMEVMRVSAHSRIPVFHEDRDRIVGIAIIRDLVFPLSEGRGDELVTAYLREPLFVPETKGILPLLNEMQAQRIQAAVVVDEYGGTAGLVTVEDIVEEVVGEIADEFDPDARYINSIGEGEWIVDGRFPIEDALQAGFPVEESDEYETMAGWVLSRMGRIPQPGDELEEQGYRVRVQTMRRRRIARLRVSAPGSAEKGEAHE